MTGHDEPPPSYDEATPASASASTSAGQPQPDQVDLISASERRAPPLTAQRALAPLSVIRSNEQIKDDYIVSIGENKSTPDVILKTTNSSIRTLVYLEGSVPRAAEVNIETTNAGISTVFPDKEEGQAVVFNVKTSNSKVQVAFQVDFDGIVTAKTSNAKINLSDNIKRNSMIIPNPPASSSNTVTYRIKPQESSPKGDTKATSDDEGLVLDMCHIQTSNSSINLGYLNEAEETQSQSSGKKKESSGCSIS